MTTLRRVAMIVILAAGCGGHSVTPDGSPPVVPDANPGIDGAPADAPTGDYADVYNAVDQDRLMTTLADLGHERYSDAGRQQFLTQFTDFFQGLGLTVRPFDYMGQNSDRPGHDLEAILPGQSADSIVVIVHYDSIGPPGQETLNPGVDDDMTGMGILFETARVLLPYQARLEHTVRFVAADEEELGGLAGARAYAQAIQLEASANGWQIVAAVDDEQTGWNCKAENGCVDGTAGWPAFDVFDCDGDQYSYPELGDHLQQVAEDFAHLHVERGCIGPNSDHYAMWEIGVPAVVFTEHDPFFNPHFDQNGGDTMDHIDADYYATIARAGITFQAQLIGIAPP